jgi:hypothetical protein
MYLVGSWHSLKLVVIGSPCVQITEVMHRPAFERCVLLEAQRRQHNLRGTAL